MGPIDNCCNGYRCARGRVTYSGGDYPCVGEGIALFEIQQNSDVTYRFMTGGRRGSCIGSCAEVAERGPFDGRRACLWSVLNFRTELAGDVVEARMLA